MRTLTKTQLVELLRNSRETVVFTKVSNGEKRTMTASLTEADVATIASTNIDTVVDVTTPNLSVIDADLGKWRSFRVDLVVSIGGEQTTVSLV